MVNRLHACTDVLDAHLTGAAVPVPVPQDVREAFERMKLFQLTRRSHAETMVCVKYTFS
jgi:hypothetical protein